MNILVIVANDELRLKLGAMVGRLETAHRARTYEHGYLLAEQINPDGVIIAMREGADGDGIRALQRLRGLLPSARFVVIAPRLTAAGIAVMGHLRPRAYLEDTMISSIVGAVLGLSEPPINVPPPTWGGGSSDLAS